MNSSVYSGATNGNYRRSKWYKPDPISSVIADGGRPISDRKFAMTQSLKALCPVHAKMISANDWS